MGNRKYRADKRPEREYDAKMGLHNRNQNGNTSAGFAPKQAIVHL